MIAYSQLVSFDSSTSPDGKTQTWMWLRAKRPLVDIEGGTAPTEMPEVPESEMMLIVPTLQIALLKES